MKPARTPGKADWGSWTPCEHGICRQCGRSLGEHAGTGCFAPDARGLAKPAECEKCWRQPSLLADPEP